MNRIGRNDLCPCGSGLKYKKCCLNSKQNQELKDIKNLYLQRHKIRLKENGDIDGIRASGRLALETLDMVEKIIKPGISTDDINTLVHDFTVSHGAIPAPLNYRGFPKSVCVSINEVICHGIPGQRILKDGDIINVDVTPILNGYYADASKTFFVGTPANGARKIVSVARESLKVGMSMVRPSNTVGDIGWAIQRYAESQGCSVVREFVGHGVGLEFHEPPQIPHYGRKGNGIRLVPGMVFTIEPMINAGVADAIIDSKDGWTARTKDGRPSAQWEHTLLITPTGHEILTC